MRTIVWVSGGCSKCGSKRYLDDDEDLVCIMGHTTYLRRPKVNQFELMEAQRIPEILPTRLNAREKQILGLLQPDGITVKTVMSACNLTQPSAFRNLKRLVQRGLAQEFPGIKGHEMTIYRPKS